MRLIRLPHLIAGVATAVALAIALVPPSGMAPATAKALALTIFGIGFWATAAIPEFITALSFFLLAMLFAVAPPGVVFGGFQSGALWLVFSGLIIGIAVKRTGLGERLAARLGGAFGTSYVGVIGGMMAISVALGFLMPSSLGRAVLLMPIALAVADRIGFAAHSPGRTGVVLAIAFGCHVPTFSILPANVPNMVLVGAAEALYRVTPSYGEYLILHFPVLGLLKAALLIATIVLFFPDRPRAVPRDAGARKPMSGEERVLAAVLALALAFWVTDFLHHVSPAWVGLAAAVFVLLPRVGLVPARAFSEQVNYGSLFYVAGIMALGGVVAHSGLGSLFAGALLELLPLAPGAEAQNFAALAGIATLTGLITTLPGTPAVLTPLAADMARASGWSLEAVLMTQVLGFSTILLPYQSAPLVVGMQLGGERLGPAIRVSLAVSAVTILVLFPLDFLWWRLLGWIG